jgi:formylglycine-generating enzyme required for sulfatase activity
VRTAELIFSQNSEKVWADVEGSDKTQIVGRFIVRDSGSYSIRLRTYGGQSNPDPVVYAIIALHDKPPIAQFVRPNQPVLKVPSNVKVLLLITAADDHGVKDVTLHAKQGNENLLSLNLLEKRPPITLFRGSETFDLAAWKVQPGTKIDYWLTVRDTKEPTSNRLETACQVIEVTDPLPPEKSKEFEETAKNEIEASLARSTAVAVSPVGPKEVGTPGSTTLDLTARTRDLSKPRQAVPDEPAKLITNTLGMKLVLIPAGEFLMGSDKDADADEKPPHRVRITRAFYLGANEVTQRQYRAVTGASPSFFHGSDDLPVEQVSWGDAIAFCNKLSEREGLKPYYSSGARTPSGGDGYRLPTEAEWEYACRAGRATRFHFGDDATNLEAYAWYGDNSGAKTHPVGQKHPNAWGLYDMHGNVCEVCWDGFGRDFYAHSPDADPTGPSQAEDRVSRGGGWFNYQRDCRSANRNWVGQDNRGADLGFRVARVQFGP